MMVAEGLSRLGMGLVKTVTAPENSGGLAVFHSSAV